MNNTILLHNKRRLFILIFALAGMTNIFAQEFTADNLKYSIIDNGSGVGVIGHVDGKNAKGNLIIPNEVSWKRKKYPVTKIQQYAFQGCAGLTSITIPNSATNIEAAAFYDCTGLTSISIPDFVTSIDTFVFHGCTGLTSISIPNSVTSIGPAAFKDCTGLTSITLPNSITSIGDVAFLGCTGLTSITIPNSVTSMGNGTFINCTRLTSISIPNSVISIGESVFKGCTSLTSIVLPNSITSIGYATFNGCTGLSSISIPNSVSSIGKSAFKGCTGLTSITLPNSITSIGDYAFQDCTELTSISIPNSVTEMGIDVFKGCCLIIDDKRLQPRFRYNGGFKMIGFDFDGSQAITSNAQYDYYEASDGTRIFDGRFIVKSNSVQNWSVYKSNMVAEDITFEDIKKIYDEDAVDGMHLALGRFSQNKQVGKWIWISKLQGSRSINVCVINFNENGIPDGDFDIYHLYHDYHYKRGEDNPYKRSYITGTITNGVIVSIDSKEGYNTQIDAFDAAISQVSGRYNREGYPIGKWSFSGSDYTDYGRNIVVEFDDEGKCIKNYRIDQTTGDKIGLSRAMTRLPIQTAWEAINYISNRFFRSTYVQWRQKNIRKYDY